MAEERKKPKIDLKTRIPSKTVKGLAPVAGGGAIPPPPGAVPAPPPDLLGRRSIAPTGDPNDPLGAAQGAKPQQQVIVVEAAHPEGVAGHASKTGMFYGIVAGVLLAGIGVGFLVGSGSADRGRKAKAVSEAKDLQAKVAKANTNLETLDNTLKQALSELNGEGLKQETIDAIKNTGSGFSAADLKNLDLAYFGEDNALKIVTWANKVAYVDELRANLTKGNALENANTALKSASIPSKQAKWGVTLEKGSKDVPITVASLVDFGEPLDPKAKVDAKDPKAPKLLAKSGALDVWPEKGDFVGGEKTYVSAIMGGDWLKACPVRGQILSYTADGLTDLVAAIEGSGDDKGTLTPGKELADKLKTIAK